MREGPCDYVVDTRVSELEEVVVRYLAHLRKRWIDCFDNDDVNLVIFETRVLARRRYPKTLRAGGEGSGPCSC